MKAATLTASPTAIPTFSGFKDFDLDLTCLSPPTSPPASIYEDARSISIAPSVSPRHSISLSFRAPSPTHSRRSKVSTTKSASPLLQNQSSTSVPRGSWPLVRYVGRGTPIDRTRRSEWGATSTEDGDADGDGVDEDGVFLPSVRGPSIDSAVSPDWNILSRRASTVPARASTRVLRPSPAIQIEGLGSEKPGEWASFVHTVLGESSSSSAASTSTSTSASTSTSTAQPQPALLPPAEDPNDEDDTTLTMTPEQIKQFDAELGIDLGLGLGGALDLGLGYRQSQGPSWFNPGGRESPSVYSSHAPTTPRASRPPSVAPSVGPKDDTAASVGVGVKLVGEGAQGHSVQNKQGKSSAAPVWWRRMMHGLKKVPLLMIGSR
ncbi:hypothetical protein C0992_006576 [Termitomyces sp. T32_za158]|nr:hypothetical protein C0992_006576 [Termitomyces sp. T32_za158]